MNFREQQELIVKSWGKIFESLKPVFNAVA